VQMVVVAAGTGTAAAAVAVVAAGTEASLLAHEDGDPCGLHRGDSLSQTTTALRLAHRAHVVLLVRVRRACARGWGRRCPTRRRTLRVERG
jgi:hypothetical protein